MFVHVLAIKLYETSFKTILANLKWTILCHTTQKSGKTKIVFNQQCVGNNIMCSIIPYLSNPLEKKQCMFTF